MQHHLASETPAGSLTEWMKVSQYGDRCLCGLTLSVPFFFFFWSSYYWKCVIVWNIRLYVWCNLKLCQLSLIRIIYNTESVIWSIQKLLFVSFSAKNAGDYPLTHTPPLIQCGTANDFWICWTFTPATSAALGHSCTIDFLTILRGRAIPFLPIPSHVLVQSTSPLSWIVDGQFHF